MMQSRKITIITGLILNLMILFNTPAYCADVAKVGTISIQKIFDNSIAGKAAKEEIHKKISGMESDLQSKGDEIKSIEEMLEKDTGIMSKEARDEKTWQRNRLVDDFKALKRKYDRQLQEFQMKRLDQIQKEVVSIVNDYGKKEGYLLILQDINTLYAPQSLDITDQIIQIYDAQHSKKNKKK